MLIDRRAFLKSMGIVGVSSMAGCRGAPLERMYAYLTPPEEMVPGVAAYYATVCRACAAGCGILARTREARPVKLEGNPAHPVNRGRLCGRGQAFIQGLYGPGRIRHPLVRRGGGLEKTSWDEALGLVAGRAGKARSLALVTGLESGAFEDLARDLGSGFGSFRHVMHETVALASMATAAGILFGRMEVPRIDLEGVDEIASLGADMLDAWVSPVELTREWSDAHAFDRGRSLHLEYVGPRRNLTATAADRWVRAAPADMGAFAAALLAALWERRRAGVPASDAGRIEAAIGAIGAPAAAGPLAAEAARIAGRLSRARKGLVLYGGAEVLTDQATSIHCAALLANLLVGSVGTALRFGEEHALGKVTTDGQVVRTIHDAAEGRFDVLVVHGTDPACTIPAEAGVKEALSAAPFVVALASERSETTDLAHVVLPVHHPLESWGDYRVARGIHGVMQPVRSPLFETRHAGDVLIEIAGRTGRSLPHASFKDFVVSRWAREIGATEDPPASGGHAERWERSLVEGGVFGVPAAGQPVHLAESAAAQIPPLAAVDRGGVQVMAVLSPLLHDGRGAAQSWLLETPDPVIQTAWEIPFEVASDVARSAGISTGDMIEVETDAGGARAPCIVCEDQAPGTVALRMGGGRGKTEGASVMRLLEFRMDERSGEVALAQGGARVRRVGSGKLTRTVGEERPGDRPLHLSVREGDARAGRFPVISRHGSPVPMPADEIGGTRPPDNMVALPDHPEHRWGLVVDLDRCTGCSACVVACTAENNVPVVGKEQVGKGRELSWIRIENHVFGYGAGRDMRFLPVMCQQCDNAPCEPVCPVFASYHTADGLNAQIYNRCIGTRYCANNCPYKVRRFNWLRWERPEIERQQLNPDVTVRARGVMEKCTFCIQRIRERTLLAKKEGRSVADGEILPACVQTCPAGALSFGDFKRPDWAMSRLARDARGYRLLDHLLNTRPGVVYLRKVLPDEEA